MSGITQSLSFSDWLIFSLSILPSSFIQVVARVRISFLSTAECYSTVCIDRVCPSIHPSMDLLRLRRACMCSPALANLLIWDSLSCLRSGLQPHCLFSPQEQYCLLTWKSASTLQRPFPLVGVSFPWPLHSYSS